MLKDTLIFKNLILSSIGVLGTEIKNWNKDTVVSLVP